ncbi:hypothetical protein [Amycolatopsis sp. cmx-4-68]|uniref:hypothetical protein n=1 Tax=Amycolatopsis sp. cmx-4-68 TaxID=2790938 RepID=UPI003978CDC5
MPSLAKSAPAGIAGVVRADTTFPTASREGAASQVPLIEAVNAAFIATAPSLGTAGDGYDNAMMESFWSKVQTELLDRKKWNTRTELANESSNTSRSSTTGNAATPSSDSSSQSSIKRLHELQQSA